MIEVSTSGSSGLRSLQAAVDAARGDGTAPALILIRDGVYEEAALITGGSLRIVGESAQRVILKTPIRVTGGEVELENLQNGPDVVGQNDRWKIPSLFLCGCREAVPPGPPPFQCHLYDETTPGGTVKGTAAAGLLGRVELFLRLGDLLALLCGPAEGQPGPCFCPGDGREFLLYLGMVRNAVIENGARLLFISHRELPQAHRAALRVFAAENAVPFSEGIWPDIQCFQGKGTV